MPGNENLEAHISELYCHGESLDSGEFGLDPKKALEKMSKFSLPFPGFWVLKFVQAAVAVRATEIHFKFLRNRVRVEFSNSSGWRAHDILDSLVGGADFRGAGLNHFRAGASASLKKASKIYWSCGGQAAEIFRDLSYKKKSAQQDDLVQFRVERSGLSLDVELEVSLPVRHLIWQTAHEFKALIDRTRRCPIPIWVDGRELPRYYAISSLEFFLGYNEASCYPFVQKALPCRPGFGEMPFPLDGASAEAGLESPEIATSSGLASGLISVYDGMGKSEIVYCLDGVDLEHEFLFGNKQIFWPEGLAELLEGLRFHITMPVREEDLSLGHFQVKKLKYRELLKEEFSRQLIQTFERLSRTPKIIRSKEQQLKTRDGFSSPVGTFFSRLGLRISNGPIKIQSNTFGLLSRQLRELEKL